MTGLTTQMTTKKDATTQQKGYKREQRMGYAAHPLMLYVYFSFLKTLVFTIYHTANTITQWPTTPSKQ